MRTDEEAKMIDDEVPKCDGRTLFNELAQLSMQAEVDALQEIHDLIELRLVEHLRTVARSGSRQLRLDEAHALAITGIDLTSHPRSRDAYLNAIESFLRISGLDVARYADGTMLVSWDEDYR